jgi:nucleoside-diphosphate-sugar epimerase
MRILVIGGTVFFGRHVVEPLLRLGHEVTLFNRGLENPTLFGDDVERLVGDRRRDLSALRGRRFDSVVDMYGYRPQDVAATADLLAPAVETYVFVSTVAVYADLAAAQEDDPLRQPLEGGDPAGATFGPLKVACEREVRRAFGERCLIVRPGLVVGPHDVASRGRFDVHGRRAGELDYDGFSGRFPYWPLRFFDGGEVLAPGRPEAPLQLVDVRDVGTWIAVAAGDGARGTFNATGPARTMGELIAACARHGGEAVWVDDELLLDHGVEPIVGLPFWVPRGHPAEALMRIPVTRAAAHGLASRPFEDTVDAVLEWAVEQRETAVAPDTPVLPRDRERTLLEAWRRAGRREREVA